MPNDLEEELAQNTSAIAMIILFVIAGFMGYMMIGPMIKSSVNSSHSIVAFVTQDK